MDIFTLDHTCNELRLSLCSALNKPISPYCTRTFEIFSYKVENVSTVLLLLSLIVVVIRIIYQIKKHYSAVGRKEFMLFFYYYLSFLILDIFLLHTKQPVPLNYILTAISLGLANTCIFILLVCGLVSTAFVGGEFLYSDIFIRIISFLYFILLSGVYYVGFQSQQSLLIFLLLIPLNGLWIFIYFVVQIIKMKLMNAEIWAYGTLMISFIFYTISIIPFFSSSYLIVYLTDSYIDGIFFIHLFTFSAIMMIHKYWLSVCTSDIECAMVQI
ncbi:Chitin synthase III catalytic subunit protein [Spraguea lophii 42_110]|uniref:Chitin synthase III catalytic subunit protein n=1 Tax=Spraguea lophii (strain 42_110) TaxID=1358809 RepID=S7W9E1_SPRLO|nr:Chitin synthase III catalytic subunit protein [Spraguea lophii 42_110]